MRIPLILLASASLIGGCAMQQDMGGDTATAGSAGAGSSITLADANAVKKAEATLTEVAGGVRISVRAMGMTPGEHGIHVHTTGKCEAPEFTSAGGHWNTMAKMHGTQNPQGPHIGDLPNIAIGADGTGTFEQTLTGATLRGANALMDADGSALIIHATADDYRTDPSGNSGGRTACGVVAG